MITIDQIKPADYNPRQVSSEALKGLKKSMDKFGNIAGITFNERSGQLVTGHHRWNNLQKKYGDLKIEHIFGEYHLINHGKEFTGYFLRVVDWDDTQEKAANISANSHSIEGEFTDQLQDLLSEIKDDLEGDYFDLLLNELESEIENVETVEGKTDDDEVPEVENPITREGDVWLLGDHRVMCGDSTMIDQVDKLMNGEKADLAFTSPPYSDQREYGGDKDLSIENLKGFLMPEIAKAWVVNLGIKRSNGVIQRYWDSYISEAEDAGLPLISWNIWDREYPQTIGQMTALFGIQHEWILVFGNIDKLNKNVENKRYGSKIGGTVREIDGSLSKNRGNTVNRFRQMSTISRIPVEKDRIGNKTGHPATYPVQLPLEYIEAITHQGESVLDSFLGSGSTLIACEKTNRKCYGMEIDPHYCDIIVNRWQNFTGKKAVLQSNGKTYDELKNEAN